MKLAKLLLIFGPLVVAAVLAFSGATGSALGVLILWGIMVLAIALVSG
jgi:hypothetical protein